MSTAAVVGFVSSLVACIPLLAQLVGFIFSIVGIATTGGGKARGRGLAIAGLVISVVVAVGWVAIGVPLGMIFVSSMRIATSMEPLLMSEADLETGTAALYDDLFSPRLKERVSQEDTVAFLREVRSEYGAVTGVEPGNPPSRTVGSTTSIMLSADFDEAGKQPIELTVGIAGLDLQIDNIRIGDKVLAEEQ